MFWSLKLSFTLVVIILNFLFEHLESSVSFHLTKVESQESMMAGVPQGFDKDLFANPARLGLWLTQLVGRTIAISA
jgi:hypothetical protein